MSFSYADTILEISLSALAENYRLLNQKSGSAQCGAVVKANAYALGVEKIAPVLWEEGCRLFYVAMLDEAVQLRQLVPEAEIYVFHGIHQGQGEVFIEHRLSPVLNTSEQIEYWRTLNKPQSVSSAIHVDTGMNRLGITLKQWQRLASNIEGLNVAWLMSHLACADTDHPLNKVQIERFTLASSYAPQLKCSLANSYGVFKGGAYHFDGVRPGCALYGVNPTPHAENPMKQVVTLKSKILQIRLIDTAQTVGYGATCMVPAGSRLAILPLGYADGYLRYLGNQGYCVYEGQHLPVVGRVSMDLIAVDISKINGVLSEGDALEILGKNVTVDDVADKADTIGYEILTSLGHRYRRTYS